MSLLRHPFSIAASLVGTASLLHAQDLPPETPPELPPASGAEPAAPPASTSAMSNLISRLVQRGVLTEEEGRLLVQQSEQDASRAQAAQAMQPQIAPPQPLDPVTGVPAGQETRVTYVPQNVRNEMRDELRQELMAQAREEKWGQQTLPDWTSKFRLFGDFRGRYEHAGFGDQNNPDALFTNYNAINSGSPYDITNPLGQLPPLYNVDEDRDRFRLRMRGGAEIMLGEGFNSGVRLATGENNSPVSPNQTLGANGGNFSKYSIWLDRAFLSYDAGPGNGDGEELTFFAGRFDNPFFSTDTQWDEDIGFDGLAFRGKIHLNDKVSTFFSGGAFPIYNTDFNFSSNQPDKFDSNDRWLYAVQAGIEWKISNDWKFKSGIAYYDFQNVQGELSSPYIPLSSSDEGDTDNMRIVSGQRGNTRMPLRNIDNSTPANNFGKSNQWQYYGLASEFRNLTFTSRLDYEGYQEIKFALVGEITKNLGFDESEVAGNAFSGGRPGRTLFAGPEEFEGGDLAWTLNLQAGHPAMDKCGDWLTVLGYRYVESDSVMDGFTDSDFGGGGTNVRGFTLGAFYAISKNVRIGARWLSSDEVDGPPLATDTFQLDLNAKF